LFVGFYQRSVDSKGRLLVPAKVLRKLPAEGGQVTLYVMLQGDHLGLYPPDVFRERASEQRPRGFANALEFTALMSLTEETDLDSSNRLRLTREHLDAAGLSREVVLVGAGDHLELWTPEAVERMRQAYLSGNAASGHGETA
jgi:MraZ protein